MIPPFFEITIGLPDNYTIIIRRIFLNSLQISDKKIPTYVKAPAPGALTQRESGTPIKIKEASEPSPCFQAEIVLL